MAVKNYCTMNGQLIGEYDSERATDYILDGLGSVIGTWRSTGTIQNQYRYSGYGQLVHKSGTGADPYFLWVGGWGYRTRGMVYVRRRTYYEKAAVWTSVDPLWPWESAYGYVSSSPTLSVDPSGLTSCVKIWFPSVPLGGLFSFSLTLDFCLANFDLTCCPPGQWAKQCRWINVNFGITFGIRLDTFNRWLKVKDQLPRYLDNLVSLITAPGYALVAPAQRECRGVQAQNSGELCISFCLVHFSGSYCYDLAKRTWKIGGGLGYCGLMSVTVAFRLKIITCS